MKLTKTRLKEIIREELLNEKYDFPKMTKDMKNIRKDIVNLTKMAQKNGISDDQIYSQLVDTGEWIKQWSNIFHGKMKQNESVKLREGKKVVKAKTVKNTRYQNQRQVAQELIKKLKKKGWKVPQYLSDESTLEKMVINAYEKARKNWDSSKGDTVIFSVSDNKDFNDKNFSWKNESVETQIRQLVKETIKDLMEGKRIQFIIPMRDRKKTAQVLKKTRLKQIIREEIQKLDEFFDIPDWKKNDKVTITGGHFGIVKKVDDEGIVFVLIKKIGKKSDKGVKLNKVMEVDPMDVYGGWRK